MNAPDPEFLSKISTEIHKASAQSSALTEEEHRDLDREQAREIIAEKIKTLKQYNDTLKQNHEERKKYARHIFYITCIWSILIFLLVIFQGLSWLSISEKVLIALITSTTVNFFGFFFLVTKYLFNAGEHNGNMDIKSKKKASSKRKKKTTA